MRRRLFIGITVLAVLMLVCVLGAWVFYGRIGEWVFQEKVLPKIAQKLGRDVQFQSIQVDRGQVLLGGISVSGTGKQNLVDIDRVIVNYDYGASWSGDVTIHDVIVSGLHVHPRRYRDGSDNFGDVLKRLKIASGNSDTAGEVNRASAGMGGMRPRSIALVHGTVDFEDGLSNSIVTIEEISTVLDAETTTAELQVGQLRVRMRGVPGTSQDAVPAPVSPHRGPYAELENMVVTVDLDNPLHSAKVAIGGGKLEVWEGLALTGITGDVQQGDSSEQFRVNLRGSFGGSDETLWYAQGWLEPKVRRGEMNIRADSFSLQRLASVLEGGMVRDFSDSEMGGELLLELDSGILAVSGNVHVAHLNIEHLDLAEEVMRDINLKGKLSASYDSKAKFLSLNSLSLVSRGVHYELSGDLAIAGGFEATGKRRQFHRFNAEVKVPQTSCQAVLSSIPSEFLPKLQGFELEGAFAADMRVHVDWSDLENLTVLEGVEAWPDFQCEIVAPSKEFDTERLMSGFEHQILVGPEEYESVDIGMESDNYSQIFDISSVFLNAVMTQEDSQFYTHQGFITREFRTALIRNLASGYFKHGASSITMQMVKNVFLYRDKTISRKVQELFLTWYVEQTLEKNRILEIYVNAIEYGPNVYGITKAAQIYFDKHPRDIKPIEAVFLTYLLPAPRRRYFQYCRGKLTRKASKKMARILKNMHKRERLTEDELELALAAKIEFHPDKIRKLCKKPPDW